jgi:hypothetical protein
VATNPILRLAQAVDRQLRQAGDKSPGTRRLIRLLEAIHFTSLKTEEGKTLQLRIALVDPKKPDPDRPQLIRPDRWTITKLENRIPLTVPSLIKLSKAADPWSSTLAVFYDNKNEFFVWGMIDQTVHFNTMLVRETEFGGYAPPGMLQVAASGTADLSVYRGFDFLARLQQDQLLTRQSDVFWSGPIHDRLSDGIAACFADVGRTLSKSEMSEMPDPEDWLYWVVDTWTRTLCRLLISIQRYRHGGALLITTSHRDLDIKYKMNYLRLPQLLSDFSAFTIQMDTAGEEVRGLLDADADDIPALTYLDESVAEGDAEDCERAITGSVRFISSLSCVDGLILATPELAIKGFGVEIRTKKEPVTVFISSTAEPHKRTTRRVDPSHYGTRHRSMMRYCFANPKSVGFVISQDGEIRAMTRVGNRLIMWENLKVLSYLEMTHAKRRRKRGKKANRSPKS